MRKRQIREFDSVYPDFGRTLSNKFPNLFGRTTGTIEGDHYLTNLRLQSK